MKKPLDLTALTRLFSKIDEGAADVYSLMIFSKAYPEDVLNYGQSLCQARYDERLLIDDSPSAPDEIKIGTYDNASCLQCLLEVPMEDWPKSQLECTVFTIKHTLPLMRHEPLLSHLANPIDEMIQEGFLRSPNPSFLQKIGFSQKNQAPASSNEEIKTPSRLHRRR